MTESQREYARKAGKLKAVADSAAEIGNVEEAAAFAARAQQLMVENELTMTDVELALVEEDDPIGRTVVRAADHGEELESGRRRAWQQDLVSAVARHSMCHLTAIPGSTDFWLTGRLSHRRAAEAVAMRLAKECIRLCDAEYDAAGRPRGFRQSFRRGFVTAVSTRLNKRRKEMEERARAEVVDADAGTALVHRLDAALERATGWIHQQYNLSRGSGLNGRSGYNREGFNRGMRRGQRASLEGPVGGGRSGPRRIGSGR